MADVALVAGIPVFWIDAPGPTRAAIIFRVGWADEALPMRGATHLVEHLSLVQSLGQTFDFNGMVNETTTTFACSGDRGQAVEFLNAVCSGLSELPMDRLEAEKRILAVEGGKRPQTPTDVLRLWRFGATGPGRGSYDEYALRWLTADATQSWARRTFNTGNAAVWMTRPPPPGLRLSLPKGDRRPLPAAQSMTVDGPSHVISPSDGLAASMLVPRSMDAAALDWLLQRRLFERLRIRDAVSYSVDVQRRPVDAFTNELFIFADGLPTAQAELERGVLDVVGSLAAEPCPPAELALWRQRTVSSLEESEAIPGLLHQMVTDHLYGRLGRQAGDIAREASMVTPESVRAVLAGNLHTCLYYVPGSAPGVTTETRAMPQWSTSVISGRHFKPSTPNAGIRMFLGPEGISHVADAERRLTIRWHECAAVLRWDDGGRRVFGMDGTYLDLQPQAWHDFPAVRAEVDKWTPTGVVVDMGAAPARPPDPLPRSRVLGGADNGVIAVLAGALILFGLLFAASGATPLLFGAVPSFALAAVFVRELYLRGKGHRTYSNASAHRPRRRLGHVPRQRLVVLISLSLAFTAATGLAAAAGATVGPLPVLFGFMGLTGVRELFQRPAGDRHRQRGR